MKKIVYVDMDNVLVDFKSAIGSLTEAELKQYEESTRRSAAYFFKR